MFEDRIFSVPDGFKKQANVKDDALFKEAERDHLNYWESWARKLDWFAPWTKTLEWNSPYSKWFLGGKLNASYNCLDRHIKNGLGKKTAIFWEGENGDTRTITYSQAHDEVNKLANVLKKLGIKKSDRV